MFTGGIRALDPWPCSFLVSGRTKTNQQNLGKSSPDVFFFFVHRQVCGLTPFPSRNLVSRRGQRVELLEWPAVSRVTPGKAWLHSTS